MNKLQTKSNSQLAREENKALIAANMFLMWSTYAQIAEALDTDESQVKWLLSQDNVQSYIDKTSSNEELGVHLKRIKKAGELMDPLLTKIETFINDDKYPVALWKDSHVNLVKDVLLNKLPNTMLKTIGLAINMNMGSAAVSEDTSALEVITKRLQPGELILFREIVDLLGQAFLNGHTKYINKVNQILSEANEVYVVNDPTTESSIPSEEN